MLITDQYAKLNAQLHADRPDYGTSGQRWAPVAAALADRVGARQILDYGCGKQTLAAALKGCTVVGYDPAIPGLNSPPHPADVVVCTDVLEHVEPSCVDDVLDDLCRVTQKAALITVATRPAVKTLADGRNAHLTVKPFSWWRESFLSRFDIVDVVEEEGNEFTLILKALHAEDIDLSSFRLPRTEQPSASSAAPPHPTVGVIKVGDRRLKFNTPNRMTQWRVESLFTKEPDTIAWLQRMQAGEVLVDIGANVGMYSVFGAICQGVRVFAFEPESQNYALLNANIALNDLSGRVVAYPLALSDRSGADALYLSEFSAGGSCHSFGEQVGFDLKPRGAAFAQGAFSVPLDQLVSSGAVPVPDHIKLDVDGFEHKVISGARETLSNPKVKSILVELNTHLEEHRGAIQLLESLGFQYDPKQAEGALRASGAFQGVGEFIFTRQIARKVELVQRTTVTLPRFDTTRGVLHHVLDRLAQTEVIQTPFPYAVVDNIFPADYYAEMLRHFPSLASMRPLNETGRVGKNDYRERMTTLFTEEDFARLPSEQANFWRNFADWMYSDTLLHAFIDKFMPALEPRIAKVQAAEGHLKVRGDALLVNDQTNYAIGPHTDAPHRLVTFLFYLPKDASMRDLGTSLYKPKKAGFTCWGGPHHPREQFDHLQRVEFLPNRLLAFPKTEHSFHGVERIERDNVSRPLLINNIRLLNQVTH
ncbi:MAG: FkbM family methyltransferase [Burkholderiales bacterium]